MFEVSWRFLHVLAVPIGIIFYQNEDGDVCDIQADIIGPGKLQGSWDVRVKHEWTLIVISLLRFNGFNDLRLNGGLDYRA